MKKGKVVPAALLASKIVRAAIHPAIGVARVGDSKNEFSIGPEVIDPAPGPIGFYRDASGALKREAARFRIFGYDSAGDVVAELTSANADISWSVHVANKKAAWYQFQIALDIPEAELQAPQVLPSSRRNADAQGKDRERLAIDGGAVYITGRNKAGPAYRFDQGRFCGEQVSQI